jgi:hypothetical protein
MSQYDPQYAATASTDKLHGDEMYKESDITDLQVEDEIDRIINDEPECINPIVVHNAVVENWHLLPEYVSEISTECLTLGEARTILRFAQSIEKSMKDSLDRDTVRESLERQDFYWER